MQTRGARVARVAGGVGATGLVVVLLVAAVILLLPRQGAGITPRVDLDAEVEQAGPEVGFVPSVPQGLGGAWRPSAAGTLTATSGRPTWRASYLTPRGDDAAVVQTLNATAAWTNVASARGRLRGTYSVGEDIWVLRQNTERSTQSLTRVDGDLTTVVTGTADYTELAQMALALDPDPTERGT